MPGEQRIVGKVDAGHDVRGAERDLLGFREKVIGVAVEHHPADRGYRHQLLGDDLGRVEHVEAESFSLLLGEDLQAEFPFWVGTRFDRCQQVPAMELAIGTQL